MPKKHWIDESGNNIPEKYISKTQKLAERASEKIVKEATKLNKSLKELKQYISEQSDKIFLAVMKEREVNLKKRKKNFTWFNFDRSIKIEVIDNEAVKYDDLILSAGREKLMRFLNTNVSAKNQFIKEMILEAVQTRNGQVDHRKIFALEKYEKQINDLLYTAAMNDFREAYRLVKSKMYYRIWVKDESGEYQNIDLNFSNI